MTNHSPPPASGTERDMLIAFINQQREILLWKLDGLTDEQLRRNHDPSGMCLLGLLKHLIRVEHTWFPHRLLGEELADVSYGDAAWNPTDEETFSLLTDQYRAAWNRSNEIAASMSLDHMTVVPSGKSQFVSLRWILLHMIEEIARHLGHADFIRESIDGTTGVGPR